MAEYSVRAECTNCGARERVTITGGNPVSSAACSTCGCKTLKRAWIGEPKVERR